MADKYHIPNWLEMKVRKRDKFCVYCHLELKEYPNAIGTPSDKATIEHMDDNAVKNPTEENIAMCCGSCNSSRGPKKLLEWFESDYCKKKGINKESVAKIVKDYMKSLNEKIDPVKNTLPKNVEDDLLKRVEMQRWTFAKTYERIAPHEYFIIKDNPDLFIKLKECIKKYGKDEVFQLFKSKTKNRYLYLGKYKYWGYRVVMNRTNLDNVKCKDGVYIPVVK